MPMTYIQKELLSTLREVVAASTGHKRTDWTKVEVTMHHLYPHEHSTKEKWRSLYRWKFNERFQRSRIQAIARRDDKRMNRFEVNERLLAELKKPRSVAYLTYRLGVTEDVLLAEVMKLQLRGFNISSWEEGEHQMFRNEPKIPVGDEVFDIMTSSRELKIALISDTHIGSNQNAIDELADFYEYAASQGVTEFYHAGDLTDGWYKHREASIFDQHAVGFQRQLDYVYNHYPFIEGCTTYFITGNHDATHTMNGGANIGEVVGKIRSDMVYLGHNFAKIWLTNKVDLNLIHPVDGSANSISLKGQQMVDKASGKRKSRLVAIGHYHKSAWLPNYKGTDIFMMPSFQFQTPFMESNNLASYVGGFILTLRLDETGELISAIPEYVGFGMED